LILINYKHTANHTEYVQAIQNSPNTVLKLIFKCFFFSNLIFNLSLFQLEESLLRFHRSNLEYACGSNLGNISSLYWDQNDEYPQFHGPPVLVQDDFSKVLDKLAKDITIVKNSPVL
jgi:hypothetical protein